VAVKNWPLRAEFESSDVLHAFLIGIRFDTVVLSYILLLPFLALTIAYIARTQGRGLIRIVSVFLFTSLSLSLVILVSNIPYFLHFFSPLSTVAFLWIDHPQYSLQMIMQEKSFFVYLIPLIVLIGVEYYFLRNQRIHLIKEIDSEPIQKSVSTPKRILIFIAGSLILLAGMRGRLSGKTPIQAGTAFFSDNALLNNTGLNPAFTLVQSFIIDMSSNAEQVSLMNDDEALRLAPSFLNIDEQLRDPNYPPAREVRPEAEQDSMNVVIIIMEAMSKFKMGKWNGPKDLTPTLNSLISKSYYFDRAYTAGIHTFNGIYSTLFSYPALYKQQPLKKLIQIPHDGLANILKRSGYQTSFFTTHDPEFDNVQGFLKANGFNKVFSELDYPSEWIQGTNGVADHRMFEYAIPEMNKMADQGKPFLSVFMTTSDHGPYIIPADIDFSPQSTELTDQIVEYADWSIGQFLHQASNTSWFKNTVFVLIADHGLSMGHTYDMPLSFHETPLIFYSPEKIKEAKQFDQLAGQIDVAPTLLGLLNISYTNNTAGIDLLREERPFMYFCADDRIGCLDKEYYLILRKNGKETLYAYENLSTQNLINEFPAKVDSMKKYTFSMMQTCQWMIDQKRLKYTQAHSALKHKKDEK
jgi:phosphoglycerol transferase MdoB-like AlkP superfamily enzyme